MKRTVTITALVCAAVLLIVSLATGYWTNRPHAGILRVGFVYSEDESTPYTANFVLAQRALAEEYDGQVEILSRSNVLGKDSERPLLELIREGCQILFINLDTDIPVTMAWQHPEVQFCQVSLPTVSMDGTPDNYHTFNGEIYQARYASGVVAGMKLRELLDSGYIMPNDAVIGFVGAFQNSEVISSFTAFLMGVHSVAPEATMKVKYTNVWDSYSKEKKAANELIDEGCILLAQYTDTVGVASACQEATVRGTVAFHVGFHESMIDVAPMASLISLRTNYTPYVLGAVRAVMNGEKIEQAVSGNVHEPNDMSGGFEHGWVEMMELNQAIAADGTAAKIARTIENLKKGQIVVFKGNYTGTNPDNPEDRIDLKDGYREQEHSSVPSFHYILDGCITVE